MQALLGMAQPSRDELDNERGASPVGVGLGSDEEGWQSQLHWGGVDRPLSTSLHPTLAGFCQCHHLETSLA